MRGGSLQNQDAGKRPIFRLTELCSSICIRTFAYFYDDTNFVPVFCPNQKKLRSQNASCHHQQARVNYKLWILYISNSISTTTPAKFFLIAITHCYCEKGAIRKCLDMLQFSIIFKCFLIYGIQLKRKVLQFFAHFPMIVPTNCCSSSDYFWHICLNKLGICCILP